MKNKFLFNIARKDNLQIVIDSDSVNISYNSPQTTLELYNDDVAFGAIETFRVMLEKAIEGELNLSSVFRALGVGYHWNVLTHQEPDDGPFNQNPLEKFWLWSTPRSNGIQTWMYCIKNNIIIECSPNYSWHFIEPKDDNEYYSFEDFINSFAIVKKINIDVNQAKLWLSICHEILNSMKK